MGNPLRCTHSSGVSISRNHPKGGRTLSGNSRGWRRQLQPQNGGIVTHVGLKPFRARNCSDSGDEEHTSPRQEEGSILKRGDYAAGRFLRDEDEVSKAAIRIRLLVSTAAPTNSSKRGRPWARQRFMPLPRKSTEMRPSMPARKRCPFLKAALFS